MIEEAVVLVVEMMNTVLAHTSGLEVSDASTFETYQAP